MFDLKGRVGLVTGGNGGIGLGLARGLAKAGAAVMVAGRNAEKNAAAVAELRALGAEADAMIVDVTDEASVNAMVAATASRASARSTSWSTMPGSTSATGRRSMTWPIGTR